MKNKSGKLVSVTLPQSSYEALSRYSKERGVTIRRMHEMLILEAVKRNLYDTVMVGAARSRLSVLPLDSEIDDVIRGSVSSDEESINVLVSLEDDFNRDHCYTGMVGDYHREYIESITPVVQPVSSNSTENTKKEDIDINEILGPGF